MKTIRLVALATLAVVMAATCAAADLTFVIKAHGVQTPPPEEPMIADT